jgi:hypothetical protein
MEIVEDCHEIDGDVIFWDTETFYSKEYSVENTDARTYCADPRGYCYIISVTDGKRVWSGTPKDFDWEIVRGKKLCAFNQNFDAAVYYFMLGAPGDSPMSGWLCAKAACNYLGLYGSLAELIEKCFGVQVSKDVRDAAEGVDFSKLDSIPVDMIRYVCMDSYYGWALWDRFGKYWPEDERELWWATVEMSWKGSPTSLEFLDKGLAVMEKARDAYKESIPLEETLSLPQLKAKCVEAGVPAPESTAKTSKVWQDWLDEYGEQVPWVRNIARYRSANRLLSQFHQIRPRVYMSDEGFERLPATLTYCGATTGRWTSGGDHFNVQQLNRNEVEGFDIRGIIRAPEGYSLVFCDWAQIEARIIAWYVGQDEILVPLREGASDLYALYAKAWNLLPQEVEHFEEWCKLPGNDPMLRQVVKAGALACGFGQRAAGLHAKNPHMTMEQCEFIVDTYHQKNPKVLAWWETLKEKIRRGALSSSKSFSIQLPSGRTLYYRGLFKKLCQSSKGKPYWAWAYKPNKFSTRVVNVSLLSNNVVQGIARDLMKNTVLEMRRQGCPAFVIIHDEGGFLVKDEDLDHMVPLIKGVMESVPPWAEGLPLLAEPKVLKVYKK